MEDHYSQFKMMDALALVCGEGLTLFFTGGTNFDGPVHADIGNGIWRASAIPADRTNSYGADFVVHANSEVVPLSFDMVVAWPADGIFVDPDPVQLPDGTWALNMGTFGSEEQYVGDDADVSKSWADAWPH